MAISQGALKNITDADSAVVSFGHILDELVKDGTIKADTCSIIKHALDAAKDKVNPAVAANLK